MRFLFALFFFISFHNIAASQQNTLMCGGKYIGYDEKFIYLNWQKDKNEFRDRISIRERSDKYIMATLPTSDKIEIKNNGRYITYYVYGRERINYLCTKVKLEQLLLNSN